MIAIYLFVIGGAIIWIVMRESRRTVGPVEQQPDERGRYMAAGGPLWSQDAGYALLKEYGMGNRRAGEYRRAFEWMVDTLETEGGLATDAIILWDWSQGAGLVLANKPGLMTYAWPQMLRNVAERAATMGKQGHFR